MSVCGVSTVKLDFEKPELRLNVLKGLRLNHLLHLFCLLSTSGVTQPPLVLLMMVKWTWIRVFNVNFGKFTALALLEITTYDSKNGCM